VLSLKPERWGSPLVQEKYQEEKACDKRHPCPFIIIIIIIIILCCDYELGNLEKQSFVDSFEILSQNFPECFQDTCNISHHG